MTASANSRPWGEDEPVASDTNRPSASTVSARSRSAAPSRSSGNPWSQPGFSQHAFGAHGVRAELLETSYRQRRSSQHLSISVGVLDIAPARRADITVRPRPCAPPLTPIPVAEVVPALTARP